MKNLGDHKKIAILIDADNTQMKKLKVILEELNAHGHVITKRAYGDWSSDYLKNWKSTLNELAINPIQQFSYTSGKNATDASMIIDAMDLLYSKKYGAFALVSSDSDFTKLASRIREEELFVFGVGEQKTPLAFRNACDDFIFIENLNIGSEDNDQLLPKVETKVTKSIDIQDISGLIGFFKKAWEQYQDDDGWVNVAAVGNFLKRIQPDFDPRSYGVQKIPQIVEKLHDEFEMKKYPGKGTVSIIAYRPRIKNK
ncbi:NYN domain-containing protein [Acinetobacter chinensis]|uniref:NYN domain-containing protein n=1 Tax=Acinetobacter chinensis TaxID=2004650 RepID=UPI0029347D9F|nr:NYN domain-containing protein [Acinetobacter chinensis]WOE42865.1 NYN domain-containing protein [Acinetobacter chinensis]